MPKGESNIDKGAQKVVRAFGNKLENREGGGAKKRERATNTGRKNE